MGKMTVIFLLRIESKEITINGNPGHVLVFSLADKEKVIETFVADDNHCYKITKSRIGGHENYLPKARMIDSFHIIPVSSHLEDTVTFH
jgi:hypothetical protein